MTLDEIYANLEPVTESGCLVWTQCMNYAGYGHVRFHGKTHRVHRVVWEAVNGPIPLELQIDHLCRVRACANVQHLELVTTCENTLRGTSLAAQRARQTHCKQGHALVGENLYPPSPRHPSRRRCKQCHRAKRRKLYDAQRRAAAQEGRDV